MLFVGVVVFFWLWGVGGIFGWGCISWGGNEWFNWFWWVFFYFFVDLFVDLWLVDVN